MSVLVKKLGRFSVLKQKAMKALIGEIIHAVCVWKRAGESDGWAREDEGKEPQHGGPWRS